MGSWKKGGFLVLCMWVGLGGIADGCLRMKCIAIYGLPPLLLSFTVRMFVNTKG